MSIFATMLGLSAGEYLKQGDVYFSEGRFGEAKIEYDKADELTPESDKDKKEAIDQKISECKKKLALIHLDMSKNYQQAENFEKAVEVLETAAELSSKTDEKYAEIQRELDHSRIKMFQKMSDTQAEPLIKRGDEFFAEGSFNEAMVEYREALKLLKYYQESEDELKKRAHQKLSECETKIVEPYIERAKNFIETEMFEEALIELDEAREILDDDNKTRQQIDKLIYDAHKKKGAAEPAAEEDFISKQEWDEAMEDYKELLNLYFNYSYTDSDPFYPVHQNKYEDGFKEAKRRLGDLYIKRAEGHFNKNKFAVALKYFVEAEKFFDDETPECVYISEKIEQCKSSIK